MGFSAVLTTHFTKVPRHLAPQDRRALVRHWCASLGNDENAITTVQQQFPDMDHDDEDFFEELVDLLATAAEMVHDDLETIVEEAIPGTQRSFVVIGGEATNGNDPFEGYAGIVVLVELCDYLPAMGLELGILGSGIHLPA